LTFEIDTSAPISIKTLLDILQLPGRVGPDDMFILVCYPRHCYQPIIPSLWAVVHIVVGLNHVLIIVLGAINEPRATLL